MQKKNGLDLTVGDLIKELSRFPEGMFVAIRIAADGTVVEYEDGDVVSIDGVHAHRDTIHIITETEEI